LVTTGVQQPQQAESQVAIVRRSLFAIATAASLVTVAVYLVAVRTSWGQRLDNAALRGRNRVLSKHDIRLAQALHTRIDIAAVVLLGSAILVVALLRGRQRLAVGIAVMITGAFITTEVLKRLLTRPVLITNDPWKHAATFPSGHTTLAMAIGIAAVFVAPLRVRGIVAILAALFAAGIGGSMVVTASHRPSDVIGGVLVATAWSAAVAAVLLRSQPPPARAKPLWTHISPWLLFTGTAVLTVAFLSAVAVVLAIDNGGINTVELGRAFVAAAGTILGTAIICTAVLTIALHDIDLDKPIGFDRPPASSLSS
jgi:membrane-associated phospholipid phosphatase